MTLKKEIDDRKDELLNEIVDSHNDNLIKAHHHERCLRSQLLVGRELVQSCTSPLLVCWTSMTCLTREAADDYLSHFEEDELEQAYEWSREQRRHDQLISESFVAS